MNVINKKLTIEELKNSLSVHDWVWIEILDPSSVGEDKNSAYYCKHEDYTHGKGFCCGYPGFTFYLDYADYNNTWTAHTYQPTEEILQNSVASTSLQLLETSFTEEQKETIREKFALCVEYIKKEIQSQLNPANKKDKICVDFPYCCSIICVTHKHIYLEDACRSRYYFEKNTGLMKLYVLENNIVFAFLFLKNWEAIKKSLLDSLKERRQVRQKIDSVLDTPVLNAEDELTAKELCQRYDIKQSDLSRRFGIPIRTVEDWYAGRRKPPIYVVQMMVEILDSEAEPRSVNS